jgi:benzoyl-CoA reductase/2-hydroxyglutaryl-CoA dehydratase subunit BcrC/BadD/HgdB
LLDRVYSLIRLMNGFPEDLSDEEAEGLIRVLPPDTARAVTALFRPRLRRSSLAFFKMLGSWLERAHRVKEEGGKVILVPFNFPVEAIHVFEKAVPVTSEVLTTLGVVALEGQGERYWDFAMSLGLPDNLCSANTVELGSVLTERDFTPDAIVQAAVGGCDVNSKIHEFVAHYLDIPQFILEKPTECTSRGRRRYLLNFLALMERLQEFIGEELEEKRVREVMERANRCAALQNEIWELHRHVPDPVPNVFALFSYGTRFSCWGREEGIRTLESMRKTALEILDKGDLPPRERARCIWIYTGYYFDFLGFFDWMEQNGISYLGDGLDLFFPAQVDTSSMDSMMQGMAEAAWNMPMTRQVGGDSMWARWLDDVTFAIKDLGADCAIYSGHHSCKQTWSVFAAVRNEITRRTGVPVLCLQGDSWIRRMTPMSVLQGEISSFVETVVAPPRRRQRRSRASG